MREQKLKKKVQVVITCQDEVLLLKLSKKRGGFWQNVTGSVDPGEEFETAATRELKEETEFDSKVFYLPLDFEFDDQFGFHVLEKIYYCQIKTKKDPVLSKEHQDFKWVKLKDLKANDYKYETNFLPIKWIKENA